MKAHKDSPIGLMQAEERAIRERRRPLSLLLTQRRNELCAVQAVISDAGSATDPALLAHAIGLVGALEILLAIIEREKSVFDEELAKIGERRTSLVWKADKLAYTIQRTEKNQGAGMSEKLELAGLRQQLAVLIDAPDDGDDEGSEV